MNAPSGRKVLARAEAQQMATDLGTAIDNLISLAAEMSDTDKVFAMDTLVLLRTKQSILEGEIDWADQIDWADHEAAETLKQAAAQQSGGAS